MRLRKANAMPLGPVVPPDAVADLAHRAAFDFEAAEVGERFAGCHADHVEADRAAEQDLEAIDRADRAIGHQVDDRVEPVEMLVAQRVEAGVEAVEGVAVARQDEQVVGELLEFLDRAKPVAERIVVDLADVDRNVGTCLLYTSPSPRDS